MKTPLAYFAVILIWATTPLAIQWSGQNDWFVGVAGRILISAVFILPLMWWLTRQPFSLKWSAIKVYFVASLGMLGGMTPMYYAAQTMPSGWISLIFGLTPLVTGVIAFFLMKDILLTPNKWLGILVSFSGLLVVFVPQLSVQSEQLYLGIALALLAVFFHSLSTVLVKKLNDQVPNTHIVAGAVWITSVVYLLAHPQFVVELPTVSTQALLSIAYLGIFGSLIGFVLYYYVLKNLDAVKVGLITLITPVVALLLGYSLNDEPLNRQIFTGAALVILGLVLFEFGHKISKSQLRLLLSRTF